MAMTVVLAVGLAAAFTEAEKHAWRSMGVFLNQARTPGEAVERVRTSDFDVVLVGGSLPADNRNRLISAIRRLRSSIPIVFVRRESGDSQGGTDATVPEEEPDAMLQEISRVLASGAVKRPPARALPFGVPRARARRA